MKNVLTYIEAKNQAFGQREIFELLKNKAIPGKQRLAFVPYMAHFVFSFMDVNRFILRDLETDDDYQKLVNIHSYEDAHHWPWYLEDLKKLGLDKQQSFSSTLLFLWSDQGIQSRMITYDMIAIARQLSAKEKIILVEVIEKTGSVFLGVTADVSNELGQGDNYLYYGNNHLACETGHHMGTDNVEDFLHAIVLNDEEIKNGYALVDKIYDLYNNFVDEMFQYASNHSFEELVKCESFPQFIDLEVLEESRSLDG
ncbi:MAG: hypothetical protein HKN34_04645 [Gammaproteobacteria bacterium]|nr:hypothetical protein [Gammaproteobacteria bacterium]